MPSVTPAPKDELLAIWTKHRPVMLERVGLIERAASALFAGELEEPLRADAQRAAHTVFGSAGTFGFGQASRTARELELAFEDPTAEGASEISALLLDLRHELTDSVGLTGNAGPSASGAEPAASGALPAGNAGPAGGVGPADSAGVDANLTLDSPGASRSSAQPVRGRIRMLLVDADQEFCAGVVTEAGALGIDCETAATPQTARALITASRPALVLLDLTHTTRHKHEVYELLSELTSGPSPIPVLVLADSDGFVDRVEAAKRGGRAFLPKLLSPAELLDAAMQSLARARLQATRVLLVDDDPVMLELMGALLERHQLEVTTLADPARFWETLAEVTPELLILDVDMPGVNGPELCRVVRNDSRWSQVAVIFVTACTDPETVEGVFRAGADDYLAKPVVADELITRVSNRLDRVRLHRIQAETDPLTGLATRAKSTAGLEQLLSLAERFAQPLSIAMLDLDHFKLVNDTHGHAAGDSVLRALGERLRRDFRGDDVVGRWGGEEFIVGMYGMSREDGVRRLRDTLARFSDEALVPGAESLRVSFSAGVAEYPRDGRELGDVVKEADEALYRAKSAGRAQVLAAQAPTTEPSASAAPSSASAAPSNASAAPSSASAAPPSDTP